MNIIKIAYKKGYRVCLDGSIVTPKRTNKTRISTSGYPVFYVRSKNRAEQVLVHRLQAYQKYGDKMFEKGIEVRHSNGVRTDNSWDNILIGTHSDNMMDIPKHIRIAKAVHASSFNKKHKHEDIIDFHNKNGRSYIKTMTEFNISSKGTLHFILNKNAKQD